MMAIDKKYVIGLGCRRGVSCLEIEKAVISVLNENNLSRNTISIIASCDLKSDEAGLLAFAAKWQLPTVFFSKEELKTVSVPNPSDKVIEKIGTPSVSEAAAQLAGSNKLLVEKHKFGNITVAVSEV
jgi:cobalamin biosynthesis protein CbiG